MEAWQNEKMTPRDDISAKLKALEMFNPKCVYLEAEDTGEGFEWTYIGTSDPELGFYCILNLGIDTTFNIDEQIREWHGMNRHRL